MSTTLSSLSGVMFQERKFYLDNVGDYEEIFSIVRSHASISQAYKTLRDYYRGKHIVLGRHFDDNTKPNNKLIHNFPKLIVDNSVSYFMGKPVSYTGDDKELLDKVQEIYDYNNAHSIDSELAKLSAEFGHSFEVFWMDEDSEIRFKAISPESMMMCYSNDIEEKPLCAVYYKTVKNAKTLEPMYLCTVYTDKEVITLRGNVLGGHIEEVSRTTHYFGTVPVNEYIVNEERMSDFEPVLSLIDAYNIACSDSVNDINYLNDAYLMLKNLISTDTDDISDMKNNRVMLVDGDGDAQWLVKNINDLHIENIKKRLVEDIHKFSMTPNISDEKFASNLSGVAISYKLNSLESKTAVKERYFSMALRRRVQIIANVLNLKGGSYEAKDIYPTFTRNIPQNLSEIVQTVVSLQDIVPNNELLPLLDFIDDPENALEKLEEERERNRENGYGDFELGDYNVSEGNIQSGKATSQDLQEK